MKVLHIMPYGIFCPNYISALRRSKTDKHFFYLYGYSKTVEQERHIQLEEGSDLIKAAPDYQNFEKNYNANDIIVINCIPENKELLDAISNCIKNRLKPYIIIPWGRDANRTSDIYNEDAEIWKAVDAQKLYLLENCTRILSTRKTYDVLHKFYKVNCPRSYFYSTFAYEKNDLEYRYKGAVSTGKVSVLVGHRGTKTSRHIDIFDIIKLHRKQIRRVICPLAYGDCSYIQYVRKTGFKLFGLKWKSLTKWIPKEKYLEFLLEKIDVAFFLGPLEGFTTMLALIAMGKTLYLDKESEAAEILDYANITYRLIGDHSEINNTLSEQEIQNNVINIKKFMNEDNCLEAWSFCLNDTWNSFCKKNDTV